MSAVAAVRASARLSLGWLGSALVVLAALVGLYLLIPIAIIFPMSLTADTFLTWPPNLVSLRWFNALFDSRPWTDALLKSVWISFPVSLMATVLGAGAALGLTHVARWRRMLQAIFVSPLVLPLIAYALGLYDVANRLQLVGSVWPVIIGQTMIAMPLVFIVVSAGAAAMDQQLRRAAASLGANWRQSLWRVELPLLKGPIFAGALIALVYSFDEIIVAYFLSPPGGATLPVQILAATQESADPTVAAASIVVIGVATAIGALILCARAIFRRSAT